jgi:pyruvate/2-oxoglutarate dehydrogenase complex dihydrolipoamide acyltransferase (E2) component
MLKRSKLKIPVLGGEEEIVIITKIYKKKGDHIKEGEPYLEFETDKAVYDLNSDFKGKILKIYVKEGDQVEVGTDVILISHDSLFAKSQTVEPSTIDLKQKEDFQEFYIKLLDLLKISPNSSYEEVLDYIRNKTVGP